MENQKRILYHGTIMENAITMLESNFSSIVDKTVWNCSDDDVIVYAQTPSRHSRPVIA